MIRIAAVGDLMLGDSSITVGFGVHSRYPGDRLADVLSSLVPRLRAADLVIGNLECPLTARGLGRFRWRRDQMRGDAVYARVLCDAGFTAVSVANNHAVQHGESAFYETVAALRSAGLLVLGLRGSRPWHAEPVTYIGPDGSTATLLAYSWRPRQYGEGPTPYAQVDPAAVLADVARARQPGNSVIVSLHWGEEFVDCPSVDEVIFAHAAADHGADLVIGHHPHVVRPLELHGTAAIAYSLGNCVTDMLWLDSLREGALLEANLSPRPTDVRLSSLWVADNYCVQLRGAEVGDSGTTVRALPADAYQHASVAGLKHQRIAAYRYAAANVMRYPLSVGATLFAVTAMGKAGGAARRLWKAKT